MLGYQQCEIRILCMLGWVLIAVAVYRDNSVGVFVDNNAVRIHTERPDHIFELLCPVYNLALIQFIRQRFKNLSRKLNTYADIDTIRTGFDLKTARITACCRYYGCKIFGHALSAA